MPETTTYDEGEQYAAGDELLPQFPNSRLIAINDALIEHVPNPLLRLVIWLAILKAIFDDAEID